VQGIGVVDCFGTPRGTATFMRANRRGRRDSTQFELSLPAMAALSA